LFTFREIIFSVIVVLDEENGDGPEEEAGDEGDAVKDSLHVTLDQTEQAVALRHLADQFFALGNLDIEKLEIRMNDNKIDHIEESDNKIDSIEEQILLTKWL